MIKIEFLAESAVNQVWTLCCVNVAWHHVYTGFVFVFNTDQSAVSLSYAFIEINHFQKNSICIKNYLKVIIQNVCAYKYKTA